MNLVTLRAEGSDKALKDLCNALSLSITSSWEKDEPMRRGGTYEKSGIVASIADTETPKELNSEIQKFLLKCKTNESVFLEDIATQLDIGIGVGSPSQFATNLTFSPLELKYCNELAIELSISAYPISDDE